MLQKLEEAGYLSSYTEVVAGKTRKYYRATPEGAAALEAARAKLRELVKEVVDDEPPKPSISSDRGNDSK
jgi:DNA-binding PadR family transcriptional regulator